MAERWQINFDIFVEIPFFLPAEIGIMWLYKRDGQHERLIGPLTSMLEQVTPGAKNHFIVIIKIH